MIHVSQSISVQIREGKVKRSLFILFVLLFLSTHAFASTVTVSGDCSASAVNTAIAGASEGDIIDVTCTGTVEWDTQINLSGGKTLRGGGAKGVGGTAGTWPLTINVTSSGNAVIYITNAAEQEINRVTGFKFTGTGNPTNIICSTGAGTGVGVAGAFRIDNNYFDDVYYSSRVTRSNGHTGQLIGLFDHNVWYYSSANPNHDYGNNMYEQQYKGVSPTCYGYDSYHRAVGHGTNDFLFVEDNYFFNSLFETSSGGGRLVFRYNEVESDYVTSSMAVVDGHGADTGCQNACGVVAVEFYNNTITGTGTSYAQIVAMRGGKWMVHNNTTQSGFLQLNEYRAYRPLLLDWKTCSGTWCCETPNCDIQEPVVGDFAACYPLPNQVQDTFVWNNILSAANMTPTYPSGYGDVSPWIVLDRDYWMPDYGLESALPGTCVTGDYYGSTDSGKLWECTSTNVWTLQYTPYTYPHPLRGADGSCGDGICAAGECIAGCTDDCTLEDCCGIEGCNMAIGETTGNCPGDCSEDPPPVESGAPGLSSVGYSGVSIN